MPYINYKELLRIKMEEEKQRIEERRRGWVEKQGRQRQQWSLVWREERRTRKKKRGRRVTVEMILAAERGQEKIKEEGGKGGSRYKCYSWREETRRRRMEGIKKGREDGDNNGAPTKRVQIRGTEEQKRHINKRGS